MIKKQLYALHYVPSNKDASGSMGQLIEIF